MVLGAQTEALHGTVLLLRSPDLLDWHLVGELAGGDEAPAGYMWECPDLFVLDDRRVLLVSPQFDHGEEGPHGPAGRFEDVAVWATGPLDGEPPRLRHGPLRTLDHGPDFYAPQTFTDRAGRVVLIGWMGKPDQLGQPPIAAKHPTVAEGWVHCLTVPRRLRWAGEDLAQWPVEELDSLRYDGVAHDGVALSPGTPQSLDGVAGRCLDLLVDATSSPGAALRLHLAVGSACATVLTVDPWSGTATLDRRGSGQGEAVVTTAPLRPDPGGHMSLRLLLDRSSVEVFLDGGRTVLSARLYPDDDADDLRVEALAGPVLLDRVGSWRLRSLGAWTGQPT
jgi:beta-fructofuranosidase